MPKHAVTSLLYSFLCPLSALSLNATEATPLPPGGVSALPENAVVSFTARNAELQIRSVEEQPFTTAARLTTTGPHSNFWEVEYGGVLNRAVVAGDVALIRFYARAVEGQGESNEAFVTVYSQKASPPWDKSITVEYSLGPEWEEYLVPYAFADTHAPGDHSLVFGLGHGTQVVDIAGVELIYYGQAYTVEQLPQTERTYAGQEADAPWRAAALQRIEQIRKGNFSITVYDVDGQPVEGAVVDLDLQRHSFPFSTAVAARRLIQDNDDNRIYRRKLLQLFNAAGTENALKWPPWEGDWGASAQETLQALRWLNERMVYVRGHVMVWPGWQNLPQSVIALRDQNRSNEIPAYTLAHIDNITQATAGLVQGWDVLNEPFSNNDLMELFGDEIMIDWFQRARHNLPTTELFLNDYGILSSGGRWFEKQDHFIQTAQYLLEHDSGISGLGVQCHFGSNVTPPQRLLEILDRLAALKLPIHVTEFDVDTPEIQLQADYTRDFYIAAFSHPSVQLIQMWGFWAGAHWKPSAALFTHDWQEKPNGAAYRTLMEETFHTRLQAHTNANGMVSGRGFYGQYSIRVSYQDQSAKVAFQLKPGQNTIEVNLTRGPLLKETSLQSQPRAIFSLAAAAADTTLLESSSDLLNWSPVTEMEQIDQGLMVDWQVPLAPDQPVFFRYQ